jgi:hypothetical protein
MSVTAVIAVMGVEPDEASRLRRRSGLIPLKVQHPASRAPPLPAPACDC